MCGIGREESADSVREMYFSKFGLDAGGGFQSELPLKGCWGGVAYCQKYLTLRDLVNLS